MGSPEHIVDIDNNVEVIEPEQLCIIVNESEATPLLDVEDFEEEELIPSTRKINIGKKILLKGCLCMSGKPKSS